MGREIVLDVIANDDVSKTLARIGRASDDCADGFNRMGGQAGQAGGEFDRAAHSLRRVDDAIDKTKAQVRALAVEFARTGDVDVYAKMRGQERVLRDLEKVRKSIGHIDLPDPEPEGRSWGTRLAGGITGAMSGLPLGIGAAISGGSAAAAPIAAGAGVALAGTLVIAMSGAMLAAGGGMGIAAGIIAATKNPATATAINELQSALTRQMADIGKPFIKPLVESIGIVKSSLTSLGLSGALRPLADSIVPLTEGLSGMVRSMMPGLRAFFSSARTLIIGLAAELPALGDALSDMLEGIAVAGPAALTVFRALFLVIEGTARTLGLLFAVAGAGMAVFGDNADRAAFAVAVMNLRANEAPKDPFDSLKQSAESAARGVDQMIESLDQAHDRIIRGMNTEADYQAAIDNTAASIREHGATLNLDTDAGRENQRQLIAQAEAARAWSQSVFDNTYAIEGSAAATAKAKAVWQQGYDQTVASARAMGMGALEAQNLATKIMGVPPSRTVDIQANTAAATGAVQRFGSAVDNLPRNHTVWVNVQQGFGFGSILQGIGARASGGPVRAGRPYIVGERNPELFVPATDGYIMPKVPPVGAGAYSGAGGVPGGGGGGRTYQISVSALDPRAAARVVMDAIQAYERSNGASWRAA